MNLLHPAELRILYVWVEAAITIEIVGARELNFSTQEKMSHTPTQNTVSLVACCRWRNGYLCFFFALYLQVLTACKRKGSQEKRHFLFNSGGFTLKIKAATERRKVWFRSTETVLVTSALNNNFFAQLPAA